MDIQRQLAAAAVARVNKMKGITSPEPDQNNPEMKMKKTPVETNADPESRKAAKSAAAAAIAARLGGSFPRGPPSQQETPRYRSTNGNKSKESSTRPATVVPAAPPGTAAPTKPLSSSDEKIASQYRKMVKRGLPPGAVSHKMKADGVPDHIAHHVLAAGTQPSFAAAAAAATSATSSVPSSVKRSQQTTKNISNLSVQEESVAAQYRKMTKLGLPPGAILHKMTADGVPPRIVDAVMRGEESSSTGSTEAGPSQNPHEQQKGEASGDSKRVGRFLGQQPSAQVQQTAEQTTKVSSLSPEEESIAAPYRKMTKLGLPPGAIRHKLTADGISARIMDSVITGELPSSEATKAQGTVSRGKATTKKLQPTTAAAPSPTPPPATRPTWKQRQNNKPPPPKQPEPRHATTATKKPIFPSNRTEPPLPGSTQTHPPASKPANTTQRPQAEAEPEAAAPATATAPSTMAPHLSTKVGPDITSKPTSASKQPRVPAASKREATTVVAPNDRKINQMMGVKSREAATKPQQQVQLIEPRHTITKGATPPPPPRPPPTLASAPASRYGLEVAPIPVALPGTNNRDKLIYKPKPNTNTRNANGKSETDVPFKKKQHILLEAPLDNINIDNTKKSSNKKKKKSTKKSRVVHNDNDQHHSDNDGTNATMSRKERNNDMSGETAAGCSCIIM